MSCGRGGMRTDNEFMPWETLKLIPDDRRRFLVQIPIGTMSKILYDGNDEQAALKVFYDAMRLNQLPVFSEVRRVVIG